MKEHIEEAIEIFRRSAGRYAKPERYYRGEHDLAFATEKFANAFGSLFREFALNLCPAVCDAVRDKLSITGFSRPGAEGRRAENGSARRIWERNRMEIRSGEVHREALVNGDAYVIVWPDEGGRASLHPNRAGQCTVVYDEEHPGRVLRAAKFWRTRDRRTRMNVFYPDRIARYITAKPGETPLPEAKEFVPLTDEAGPAELANPYAAVPVFHFANNADIGAFGVSELVSAIPVQDGLNKSMLDMLVAMEYSAYRQRWAAGIEVEYDTEGNAVPPFKAGVDHLWVAPNPEARFGDFGTANLDQFIRVKDSFRVDMASVTGTPMYYLLPHSRGFPSGEALKKAETRFISKVHNRQTAFGRTWADAVGFALKIEREAATAVVTEWDDPTRMSERELLENMLLRQKLGGGAAPLME